MPRLRILVLALLSALLGGLLTGAITAPTQASGENELGGVFVPVTPFRAGTDVVPADTSQTFQVAGTGGIPSTGVSSVVLALSATSTDTTSSSYLTAYASTETRPAVSTLTYTKQTAPRSSTALVKVGSTGKISVYNKLGNTRVYLDVQGYFTSTSTDSSVGGFVPVEPTRVARSDTGEGMSAGTVAVNANRDVQVTGLGGVPSDATSVYVNVIVSDGTAPGAINLGRGGSDLTSGPAALRYGADGVYSGGAAVPLSADGKIRLRNTVGNAIHVRVDVYGFFTGTAGRGSAFTPVTQAPVYSSTSPSDPIGGGETRTVEVRGTGGLPANDSVVAAALVLTTKNWSSGGSVSLWNADLEEKPIPPSSNFVGTSGDPATGVTTSTIVALSEDGHINITNTSNDPVDVQITASGYFSVAECEFSVSSGANGSVTVTDGNSTETLTAQPSDDTSMQTFEGEISNENVSVDVWMGADEAAISAELDDAELEQETLHQASLDEAVDGDLSEVEEESEISNPTQVPSDYLEPVGYKLESADTLEYGSLTASACEKIDPGTTDEVVMRTAGSVMVVPVNDTAAATSRASMPSSSAVRYRTFIPAAKGNGLHCGYFKGDNRGFTSYYSASNRSRATSFFNWTSRTITTTKNIGATHRLSGNGFSAKTRTASSRGIKFHHAMMASTYGKISINHSVGNPLCGSAGPIRYNVVVEAWRYGAARISGKRGKVPNHEAYLYPRREAYGKTIFKRSSSKFICLSLNCGDESLWETT